MNILVLGATGTFGTALTEKLLKHTNDTITLFARHASEKYSASEHTAYIGLYYLHRVNEDIPVEDVAEAMGHLIKNGVIRGWGIQKI